MSTIDQEAENNNNQNERKEVMQTSVTISNQNEKENLVQVNSAQPKKAINWDRDKIRIAIKNLSENIHNLKKEIRQPHVNITYQQHCSLTNLKDAATLLCVVTAHRRHRVHLHGLTFEQQDAWLKTNLTQNTIKSFSK